MVKRFSKM